MTNSSDSKKKKGPIRTGAVVPTLILAVLVGGYFMLFFDGNLRRGLEYIGSHVNGAEVDVGRVSTSFLHAKLEIDNIELTDKEHPERNTVQIGSVRFQMLWDALLRGKVVVDDASILNIQALTPRRHPGFVIPPTPPSASKGPSALENVQSDVLAQTRKQFNGNFLGDVAGLLGGKSQDQLKNIEGQLKSEAKIKALQGEVENQRAKWDKRLKELPQGKEMQGYADRMKALKFDIKNPGELAKNVQAGQKIISEANDKVKLIDQAQRDFKTDLGNTTQEFKDVDKLIEQDMHDLQSRLKLPNIDAKEFSQQLFMSMIEKKLGSMAKYVVLARHYMPAKKTAAEKAEEKKKTEEAAIVPPKRGTGKTYGFPITTGYPLFWLQHAAISSEVSSSEYSGNIKGEIKDVTSDPAGLGRPALILLSGDFPKQNIHGLNAKITLDHTTDAPKESLDMKVAHFPTGEQKLSDSPDVGLNITQAAGSSSLEGTFINDELTMNMKNTFGDVKYDLKASSPVVKEIIDNVLKGIPTVDVNADIKGSLHNLDIHINSNLGEDLSKGFQKQLQAKLDEAKGQLKKMIDGKIGGDRDKLKGQMDQLTGGPGKGLDDNKGAADKAIKEAQNSLSKGQKGGGLPGGVGDALKKIKF